MNRDNQGPFVASVVGNTSVRFGLFDHPYRPRRDLPQPLESHQVPADALHLEQLPQWCCPSLPWFIASVRRDVERHLVQWVQQAGPNRLCKLLRAADFPLEVHVDQPDGVGADRLAGAVAVNRLRTPDRAAIFVDSGTALTANLIDETGVFLGGAILPGMRLAASALARDTDLLPHIRVEELNRQVAALGRSTPAAIRSGLVWGAIGAIRELIARLSLHVDSEPEIFLTGGGIRPIADELGTTAQYIPDLVIRGVAASRANVSERNRETAG